MQTTFKPGDVKELKFIVTAKDFPTFPGGTVHEVYSTYALIRDAEWTTRQFVLMMKDDDEEGIGTMVNAAHYSPAFEGEEITISATIVRIDHDKIVCTFRATAGTRLIAEGKTGQKIMKKEKLKELFLSIKPASL